MANYKAVTADEVYMRGGTYNGETGSEKAKCVRYADRTTWCQNHGCTFNKVTNLNYSANSVLAINDIKINNQQQEDEPVVVHKTTLDLINYYGSGYNNAFSKRELGAFYIVRTTSFRVTSSVSVSNGDTSIPLQIGVENETATWEEQADEVSHYDPFLDKIVIDSPAHTVYHTAVTDYPDYESSIDVDKRIPLSRRVDIYFEGNNSVNVSNKTFCFVVGQDYDSICAYLSNNQQTPSGVNTNFSIGWYLGGTNLNINCEDLYNDVAFYENEDTIPILQGVDIKIGQNGFAVTFPKKTPRLAYLEAAAVYENTESEMVVFVFHNFSV